MDKKTVFTIGREYGSGGREIGKRLADELQIPFYDKELISLAAQEGDINEEVLRAVDERAANSLLYSMVIGAYPMGAPHSGRIPELPLNDKLFILQCGIIKKPAQKGSCVIVGRCADYVLKDDPNCVKVFIHADMQNRAGRIKKLHSLTDKKAEDLIIKTDKKRKSYYNYYSGLSWGKAGNYDITLNSGIGLDRCVEILKMFYNI